MRRAIFRLRKLIQWGVGKVKKLNKVNKFKYPDYQLPENKISQYIDIDRSIVILSLVRVGRPLQLVCFLVFPYSTSLIRVFRSNISMNYQRQNNSQYSEAEKQATQFAISAHG